MKFTEEEIKFIREELGIEAREIEEDEELLCEIQDAAFDVEAEEANRLENLTRRGELAAELVTRLGQEEPNSEQPATA